MFRAIPDRVQQNTAPQVNAAIQKQTEQSVARAAKAGPQAVGRRLRELDEEWDVERYLETVAPTFTLLGIFLGFTRDRRWFALPVAVQGFFLMHAVQGWCPPLPVLRSLGIRTQGEINEERNALKAIHGDNAGVKRRSPQGTRKATKSERRQAPR